MKTIAPKIKEGWISTTKQLVCLVSFLSILFPTLILRSSKYAVPGFKKLMWAFLVTGVSLLTLLVLIVWLFSRFSPIESLRLRKKLLLFTRMFIKPEEDSYLLHSVTWKFSVKRGTFIILLYPNGLVKDTGRIGEQLVQYLGKELLSYQEEAEYVMFTFGTHPKRLNGWEVLQDENL